MTTSRDALRADCASCSGLCCVVPTFARSSDFAIDKPAGTPCPNLLDDSRCGIHDRLRDEGFAGCTVYDCFGAGQRTTQQTYDGQGWRVHPEPTEVFTSFRVLRDLHELLWYLDDVLDRDLAPTWHEQASALRAEIDEIGDGRPSDLARIDVGALHSRVDAVLRGASQTLRAGVPGRVGLARADLVGAGLEGRDLRGADLRGALLLGADLRGADLRLADLVGADLRGADVSGARLETALFVTQTQVNGGRGDELTTLPARLERPRAWSASRLG